MSRSINKVQDIFFSVMSIFHLYGMTLDGYTSFAFEVHVVQHLPFSHLNSICKLQ